MTVLVKRGYYDSALNSKDMIYIDSHGDLYNSVAPGWPVEGITVYYLPFGIVLIALI